MTEPKQIATLPPIEESRVEVPLSERTGEPRRPAVVVASVLLLYAAAVALAVVYALHWWDAAHPGTYPESARLIAWVSPEPGRWLSLLLEGGFAAAVVLAAGACGVAAYQAWAGVPVSRWAGVSAVALSLGFAIITDNRAFAGFALAGLGAGLLFLSPVTRYLNQWARLRREDRHPYRRPPAIFYGRLPRFR